MVVLEATEDGGVGHPHLAQLPAALSADEIIQGLTPRLAARWHAGDAFPRWFPNFGPGVVAAFLGSPVSVTTDSIWFGSCLAGPLARINLACDPANRWWRRATAVTHAAARAWGGKVMVAITDLGGNLDILASLRGTQQLLLDLADAPDEVARLAGQVTRAWLQCYDALADILAPAQQGTASWAPFWAPGRTAMLQCDISCMISPRLFARLVLPDLEACCSMLDYAFYHLDGPAAIRHLDALFSIERLRGIQWIPGAGAPPAEAWIPLLRRIRDAGKLCQIYVSAEGAVTIARALGGKGFAFCIPDGRLPGLQETRASCALLAAEGLL